MNHLDVNIELLFSLESLIASITFEFPTFMYILIVSLLIQSITKSLSTAGIFANKASLLPVNYVVVAIQISSLAFKCLSTKMAFPVSLLPLSVDYGMRHQRTPKSTFG